MKRFIFFLVVLGGLGGGYVLAQNKSSISNGVIPTTVLKQQAISISTEPAIPYSITIPKANVSAHVESVGEDSQGRMDIPQVVTDAAWFKLGYKPGTKGSAVIDAHYDTVTGAPSVFYKLGELASGDKVIIADANGKIYSFHVVEKQSFPYDKVPLKQIFATADKPRLNLITCAGTWDKGAHNYSQRTVVYTILDNIN